MEHFDATRAEEWRALAEQNGIIYSCLSYNENLLHSDPTRREQINAHLRRVIDAAHLLGVNVVNTFIGRDESKTERENLDEMERVFAPLLDYAAQHGVRLAIENCPMVGWQFEGLPGNIAYSPKLWDEMFRRLPYPNFGLALDPSHLAWLGVDYYAAARDYASRIFHTHAKDTEIFHDRRGYGSILEAGSHSWWRYRLPGLGEVDWRRWIDTLKQGGYDGPLSIEHEDPVWEGTEDKVKTGLLMGKKHLEEAKG